MAMNHHKVKAAHHKKMATHHATIGDHHHKMADHHERMAEHHEKMAGQGGDVVGGMNSGTRSSGSAKPEGGEGSERSAFSFIS